jgi:hypothetical protein
MGKEEPKNPESVLIGRDFFMGPIPALAQVPSGLKAATTKIPDCPRGVWITSMDPGDFGGDNASNFASDVSKSCAGLRLCRSPGPCPRIEVKPFVRYNTLATP